MAAQTEALPPAEAAVVAGVSLRDVHRMIDEHILPERLLHTSDGRSFKREACVFISFYVGAVDRLTSEERQKSIDMASRTKDWVKAKRTVQDDFLTIDFSSFWRRVEERMARLESAREMVVSDSEILGGTPVIRGTRVPVYSLAASLTEGTSVEELLSSYPSVTREQVELAALYAEATPQRGRPRRTVGSSSIS